MMKSQNAGSLCRKPMFLFISSILLMRLPVHLSKAASTDDNISFSFPRFIQTLPEIMYESNGTVGRNTYYKPMHLWENSSGNLVLADFTTRFSFATGTSGNEGDGFAFFLAPNGSQIPPDAGGDCLGLQSCYSGTDSEFVAVEFDTHPNIWDPFMSDHVGIDLNNVTTSLADIQWRLSDTENRGEAYAFINYNSSTRNLNVVLLDADDSTRRNSNSLSITLDLSKYLPEWVTFGFSGGDWNGMHTIYSWNFSSSLQGSRPFNTSINPPTAAPKVPSNPPTAPAAPKVPSNPPTAAPKFPSNPPTAAPKVPSNPPTAAPKVPSNPPAVPGNPPVISRRKSRTWLWVVLAIAGGISALIPGLGSVWFLCRRREYGSREHGAMSVNVQMEMVTAPRQFSYKELRLATSNFANDGLLGEGGFGKVYLGFLKDMNCSIAVKRITPNSGQGVKEYVSEVTILSRLRHRNLVQLIGWCHDNKDFLIVYEFLPNKSLDYHLQREPCSLTWDKRYKIAMGLASALFYLHEQCDQCMLHRDIKSSNVLLDLSFNAKLGDFGLARLVEHGQGSQTTKVMRGTDGYIAPECLETYKAIKESDIYSFGIVALEIASGNKAIAVIERNGNRFRTKLVEWVWELYGKERLLDAADQGLYGNYDMEQMERLLLVGLACAHPNYVARPSITQVIDILCFKAPLPLIPSEMPLPA